MRKKKVMRGKAFIVFTVAAASLALGAAASGGGGPDITVEKGVQVTGGLPIEGAGGGGFATGEAPAVGFVFIERFFEGEPFDEPFRDGFPESEPFTKEDLQPIVDDFIKERTHAA